MIEVNDLVRIKRKCIKRFRRILNGYKINNGIYKVVECKVALVTINKRDDVVPAFAAQPAIVAPALAKPKKKKKKSKPTRKVNLLVLDKEIFCPISSGSDLVEFKSLVWYPPKTLPASFLALHRKDKANIRKKDGDQLSQLKARFNKLKSKLS